MTSLSDVYEGGVRTVVDRRRRLFATTVFATGVAMCAVAIVLTTTGARSWVGLDIEGARRTAGILAGLGLPAAMVGVFTALPASDETRAAAVIGTSVSVFGVFLFVYAYPERWLTNEPALALSTVAVYTLGVLVTFWCLFVAVATFNRRGDPGGTTRVEVTDEGTIELVRRGTDEESSLTSSVRSVPGLGGIGLVGSDPAGDVPTQTSDGGVQVAEQRADEATGTDADTDPVDTVWTAEPDGDSGSEPASNSNAVAGADGASVGSRDSRTGSEQQGQRSSDQADTGRGRRADNASAPEDEPTTGGWEHSSTNRGTGPGPTDDGGQSVTQGGGTEVLSGSNGQPDAYCGNCAYFEYVGDTDDLEPYCRYHRESMEDLEPCEQWTANTTDQ
ncbi:MAG: hypothetical protein J07HX64_02106 [halophilic archaeon J07HX64]|jgi:hypothetical protein|nr:MAG: hypothetical protein J07HX64_02106 [halophilic archaeon J07HX64]